VIEAWVTVNEAMELTGLARRSIYHHMRTSWVTRPAWHTSKNGRNPREITLDSLPTASQALYWVRRRRVPLCDLLNADIPGLSYSDQVESPMVHHG
jgi:predicted DNA-binding transcriptional regulator AlpA